VGGGEGGRGYATRTRKIAQTEKLIMRKKEERMKATVASLGQYKKKPHSIRLTHTQEHMSRQFVVLMSHKGGTLTVCQKKWAVDRWGWYGKWDEYPRDLWAQVFLDDARGLKGFRSAPIPMVGGWG